MKGIVAQHFRPEFVNRIDEMVVFEPLSRDDTRGIAKLQVELLNARLSEQVLLLEVSDEALEGLVESGYDEVYGARPLKRCIQRQPLEIILWIRSPVKFRSRRKITWTVSTKNMMTL